MRRTWAIAARRGSYEPTFLLNSGRSSPIKEQRLSSELWFAKNPLNCYGPHLFPSKTVIGHRSPSCEPTSISSSMCVMNTSCDEELWHPYTCQAHASEHSPGTWNHHEQNADSLPILNPSPAPPNLLDFFFLRPASLEKPREKAQRAPKFSKSALP